MTENQDNILCLWFSEIDARTLEVIEWNVKANFRESS
jgi:hypothetical protein